MICKFIMLTDNQYLLAVLDDFANTAEMQLNYLKYGETY